MVTKKQVKKCLDKYANDYLSTREETECFDYAIKAVDAYKEPKEAIIDVVHKTIYGFFDVAADDSEEPMSEKDKLLLEVNKAVCNAVKDMPDDERKTGKWINRHYAGERSVDTVICTECGEEFSYDAETGVSAEDYNFCPHCGEKKE